MLEVLSPAGDMERLQMALAYGADAVYLAGQQFGMRAAAGNFSAAELEAALKMSHEKNVKVYVTCNTIPRNDEVPKLPEFLEFLNDAGADGIIATDIGVIAMVKKYAPRVDLHVSTQSGIANYECARAFYDLGAKRIVLARELTLSEIAEIREKTPKELEIEAFCHGSMCVSFSGRCLLSNYLTGRDANRGACAQPCRWKYHLVEEKHPGEYFEISEDNGTFIMNSKDMCMIEHIPELMNAGVTSLKIEGRMKSAYYTAIITNAYRHAADAAMRGERLSDVWKNEVNNVSHREYSTGFFMDKNGPGQFYENAMYFTDSDVVAQVLSCDEDGNALLSQRNKFYKGDRLEVIAPGKEPMSFIAGKMIGSGGEAIDSTPHPMMEFKMKLPCFAPELSFVRKIKTC